MVNLFIRLYIGDILLQDCIWRKQSLLVSLGKKKKKPNSGKLSYLSYNSKAKDTS